MEEEKGREITTTEWYDFIGNLGEIIPALHLGGKEATRALIQMCGISPESHVLDVGCGTGYTACEIAREHGSRVTGIDISEIMVSKARQRARKEGLGERVEFVLDGGRCPGGVPSTVVDCTVIPPVIRRRGALASEVEAFLRGSAG